MSDDDLTAAEYRAEIKSTAEALLGETIQYSDHPVGSDSFEDELSDDIWQMADSHSWMIYSGYHMDVLRCSDREPDEWQMYVDLEDSPSYREVIQAMAFDVFYHDLYRATFDALESIGEYREKAAE